MWWMLIFGLIPSDSTSPLGNELIYSFKTWKQLSTYYSSALCEEKQHAFNHTLKDLLSLKPAALEQEFWASS